MRQISNNLLAVGGLTPFSTIDYPNLLSAVIFCQGCSWRCRYCHNPDLLPAAGTTIISWTEIIDFLQSRQGLLDAVVFSGGEPILQKSLLSAIKQVRDFGYRIGLHTAGSYPKRLLEVLPFVDWIGLDVKAPTDLYLDITGIPGSGAAAWQSAKLIIGSGVAYEIRVTIHPSLLTPSQLDMVLAQLEQLGAKSVVLQPCRVSNLFDTTLSNIQVDMRPYQSLPRLKSGYVRIRY